MVEKKAKLRDSLLTDYEVHSVQKIARCPETQILNVYEIESKSNKFPRFLMCLYELHMTYSLDFCRATRISVDVGATW